MEETTGCERVVRGLRPPKLPAANDSRRGDLRTPRLSNPVET